MELSDKKFAVLIDADNISHRKIKDILDEIANYGTPTIKRIYGDFTDPKFAAWKSVLLENSITPIQQYAYCIVSSDSDYTRLASRIRESGREVLGFGEKKTPKPFIKSCDKFIYVEILGQPAPAPAPVSAPAQTAAAVPAAKAATPKKTAKKHQGRNAPETDMPEAAPAEPAAAEKKVAPAPDTAQPQPIIRPIDDDFKTLLANTIEDAADDSGWAFLGIVGGVLTKKMPDFDPRNYGYKKLSLLVKSLSKIVEIEERPSENKELKLVYVRNRIR